MKLKPCKFCKLDSWKRFFEPGPYLRIVYYGRIVYCVQCTHCDSRTAGHSNKVGAIRGWNRMMTEKS